MSSKTIVTNHGCIFHPSIIDGSNLKMSKVGFRFHLLKEFRNIKALPPGFDFYFDTSLVKLFRLPQSNNNSLFGLCSNLKSAFDEINSLKELSLEDKDDLTRVEKYRLKKHENLWGSDFDTIIHSLEIPFINGVTLRDYFLDKSSSTFRTFIIERIQFSINRIGKRKFFKLIKALIVLYFEVKKLNTEYKIFHNDLHEKNILCVNTEEELKLKIIDFELMTIGEFKNPRGYDDLDYLRQYIKMVIACGFFNDKICTWLVINDIIKPDHELSEDMYNIDGEDLINLIKKKLN